MAERLGGPGLLVKSKISSRPAPSRGALADDGYLAVAVDRVTARRGEQRLRHLLLRMRRGVEDEQAVTPDHVLRADEPSAKGDHAPELLRRQELEPPVEGDPPGERRVL